MDKDKLNKITKDGNYMRSSLIVAMGRRYADMPIEDYTFSEKYQTKFDHMLADPNWYLCFTKAERALAQDGKSKAELSAAALQKLRPEYLTDPIEHEQDGYITRETAIKYLEKYYIEDPADDFSNLSQREALAYAANLIIIAKKTTHN